MERRKKTLNEGSYEKEKLRGFNETNNPKLNTDHFSHF